MLREVLGVHDRMVYQEGRTDHLVRREFWARLGSVFLPLALLQLLPGTADDPALPVLSWALPNSPPCGSCRFILSVAFGENSQLRDFVPIQENNGRDVSQVARLKAAVDRRAPPRL